MNIFRGICCLIASVTFCSASKATVPSSAYLLNNFDSSAEVNTWAQWPDWGDTPISVTFDSGMNNGGTAGSGSMKVSATFSNPDSNAGFAIGRFFSGTLFDSSVSLPTSAFSDLSMDLRWDPASAQTGFGTFGLLFGAFTAPDEQFASSTGSATPISETGWTHVSFPVPSTYTGNISSFLIFMFDGYDPSSVDYISGTETFWIDNVSLTPVPEPSPAALLGGGAVVLRLLRSARRKHA